MFLGIPGQLDYPRINDIVREVIAQARAADKAVGIGAVDDRKPERIRVFLTRGAEFYCGEYRKNTHFIARLHVSEQRKIAP